MVTPQPIVFELVTHGAMAFSRAVSGTYTFPRPNSLFIFSSLLRSAKVRIPFPCIYYLLWALGRGSAVTSLVWDPDGFMAPYR